MKIPKEIRASLLALLNYVETQEAEHYRLTLDELIERHGNNPIRLANEVNLLSTHIYTHISKISDWVAHTEAK